MEPEVQPESDDMMSWSTGMSPSSSLMFVLHVRGVVIEVVMQPKESCQPYSAGRAGRLSLERSRERLLVGQGGRTMISM